MSYPFLESIFFKLDELQKEDDYNEEKVIKALKEHIDNHLEIVKDHYLLNIDHLSHATFIAVNNMQDVRLYSLEAEIKGLKAGEEVSWGQLILEITIIVIIELGIVITSEFVIIPLISAGVASIIATTTKKRRLNDLLEKSPLHNIADGMISTARKKRNEAYKFRFNHENKISDKYYEYIESAIKLETTARKIKEEASKNNVEDALKFALKQISKQDKIKSGEIADNLETYYKKFKDYRGQDATSGVINSFLESVNLKDTSEKVNEDFNKFTPGSSISSILAELQSLKTYVINEYHYLKTINNLPDNNLQSFFDNDAIKSVLSELDSAYPFSVYASNSMLSSLEYFSNRIEFSIWLIYFITNGILNTEQGSISKGTYQIWGQIHHIIAESENILFFSIEYPPVLQGEEKFIGNQTLLLIEDKGISVSIAAYLGLASLSEYQSQYLYIKFVLPDIEKILNRLKKFHLYKTLEKYIKEKNIETAIDDEKLTSNKIRINHEREKKINIMKLCVIEYFLFKKEELSNKKIPGYFLPDEYKNKTFDDVIGKIKAPEIKPDKQLEPEQENPGQQRPDSNGEPDLVSREEFENNNLLYEMQLLLFKSAQHKNEDFELKSRESYLEIDEIIERLSNSDLTEAQEEKFQQLMDEYDQSPFKRGILKDDETDDDPLLL